MPLYGATLKRRRDRGGREMSRCERCGVFYEEAESPEAGLCAVCASGEPEAAPVKWGGADLVQDELFGVAQ